MMGKHKFQSQTNEYGRIGLRPKYNFLDLENVA